MIGGKEDQYQKNITITPAGPGLVYDLENDGRYQVLATIKNEHGDGNSHLVVFDAPTGKRLAELPAGAKVGTSSLRRAAQLRALRPDLEAHSAQRRSGMGLPPEV